jgi:hypothetical protein
LEEEEIRCDQERLWGALYSCRALPIPKRLAPNFIYLKFSGNVFNETSMSVLKTTQDLSKFLFPFELHIAVGGVFVF